MEKIRYIIWVFVINLLIVKAFSQPDRTKPPLPGPAPKVNIGEYKSFTLKNGLKVFIVENHKLPRVSFNITLDFDPVIEGENVGTADMTGQLLRAGTRTRTKAEIDDQIDFIGARLNASAKLISGSSLKKHMNTFLEMMSDVLLNPVFPQAELDKLKKQAKSSLLRSKEDANVIANNVARTLRNGKKHPYGELITEATIEKITIEKSQKYYSTYFRPNVAYLVIVGDINETEAEPLITKYFGNWQKGEVPKNQVTLPVQPVGNIVAFVDKKEAVQSVINITYPVDFKPGSEDEIKALVMNGILGGGASGRLFRNLREDKGYTYGAYSSLTTDEYVGSFSTRCQVRGNVTDSSIIQYFYEMKRICDELVPDAQVELIKNVVAGAFARSLENPQTVANFALNTARYNLPKDHYQMYLDRLSKVTASDVKSVARKYIKPDNCYIVVVGNKEKEADKLKTFSSKKQVDFFDNYGNPWVEKEIEKVDNNININTIIGNYLKAIGGIGKLLALQNISIKSSSLMMGREMNTEVYKKVPNLYVSQTIVDGTVMGKQIFDGQKGFRTGRENREITGDALEELKANGYLFIEMNYNELGYKLNLLGIETLDGKDAYKLEIVSPTGKKSVDYFDVNTSLKVRTLTTREMRGNVINMTIDYKDYKDVDGIKFPFTVSINAGQMQFDQKVISIDIKTPISPDLFKTQ